MYELYILLVSIALGYYFGRRAESRHFKSIIDREKKTQHQPAVSFKFADTDRVVIHSELATGSTVIAIDAFKKMLAGIVNLIGGEVHSYSSLLDRARREAVLRMKESSPEADAFLNMRVETATIMGQRQGSTSSVEVMAYGTAVKYQ